MVMPVRTMPPAPIWTPADVVAAVVVSVLPRIVTPSEALFAKLIALAAPPVEVARIVLFRIVTLDEPPATKIPKASVAALTLLVIVRPMTVVLLCIASGPLDPSDAARVAAGVVRVAVRPEGLRTVVVPAPTSV